MNDNDTGKTEKTGNIIFHFSHYGVNILISHQVAFYL